ncbi:15173_t:CDS:1, partial [Cetraspora pellucida]
WEHDVKFRIELSVLHEKLYLLNKELSVQSHSPGIQPKKLGDDLCISDLKLSDVPNKPIFENQNAFSD